MSDVLTQIFDGCVKLINKSRDKITIGFRRNKITFLDRFMSRSSFNPLMHGAAPETHHFLFDVYRFKNELYSYQVSYLFFWEA